MSRPRGMPNPSQLVACVAHRGVASDAVAAFITSRRFDSVYNLGRGESAW